MKFHNLILGAALMLVVASCGSSKNVSGTNESANAAMIVEVPAVVITDFSLRYPRATNVEWMYYDDSNVPIDWELTDWEILGSNDFVVRYSMDDYNYYSWYDANGNWIGSSYTFNNFSALPYPVNNLINTHYPGYRITEVNTETWKDKMAYEIELKNENTKVKMLVDANGNIIKQKTKDL